MCDFCNTFDFSTAKIEISDNRQFAHIILAICNTRFDKSEQCQQPTNLNVRGVLTTHI